MCIFVGCWLQLVVQMYNLSFFGQVLLKMMEIDKLKNDYNKEACELLEWINTKLEDFKSVEPLRSLEDIQQEIHNFKDYRLKEKPVK